MNIIEKIFGTHSENELKRIYPIVDKIEALGPEMEALSDEELRGKTREFKERLKEGETLDDILPEAFAVVREGAYRSIGRSCSSCVVVTRFTRISPVVSPRLRSKCRRYPVCCIFL